MTTAVQAALLSTIPELRAFALSLCGNRDRADDLVQEALLSAWAHLDNFQEGTNMAAWLFTILRNRFINDYRKGRIWVEDVNGKYAEGLSTRPNQDGWVLMADLRAALARLPPRQREAVILVGASGLTIAEAASVCGCELGTIKSRVNRARVRLAEMLAGDLERADDDKARDAERVTPEGAQDDAVLSWLRHRDGAASGSQQARTM
jgi:RNA polymerase sigma-70 factor, ECF subfamily